MATVVIKKYGNRRLYDTGDSRYVTLEELAAKIRSGSDVHVVDAQSGEDLTQVTLTQIVLETGNAAKFLPVKLLTQMIRLSDDALAEFFSRYVTAALDMYLQAKRTMTFNPIAQLPMAATDALARLWMGTPYAGYPYPPQPPAGYAPPSPYVQPPPPPEDEAEEYVRKRTDTEPTPVVATPGRKRADTVPDAESRADDMAAMRRELDELKAALLGKSKPRKKKP